MISESHKNSTNQKEQQDQICYAQARSSSGWAKPAVNKYNWEGALSTLHCSSVAVQNSAWVQREPFLLTQWLRKCRLSSSCLTHPTGNPSWGKVKATCAISIAVAGKSLTAAASSLIQLIVQWERAWGVPSGNTEGETSLPHRPSTPQPGDAYRSSFFTSLPHWPTFPMCGFKHITKRNHGMP